MQERGECNDNDTCVCAIDPLGEFWLGVGEGGDERQGFGILPVYISGQADVVRIATYLEGEREGGVVMNL